MSQTKLCRRILKNLRVQRLKLNSRLLELEKMAPSVDKLAKYKAWVRLVADLAFEINELDDQIADLKKHLRKRRRWSG